MKAVHIPLASNRSIQGHYKLAMLYLSVIKVVLKVIDCFLAHAVLAGAH